MLMELNRDFCPCEDVGRYTIEDLSKMMRDIDFVMFFTKSEHGELAGRPMSNNGEVDYDVSA